MQKSIIITGCSSGIGRCTAFGLHQRGYRVFATARRDDDVAALQAQGLESLKLDLDDAASITTAVEEILQRTDGRIYALFNNGGWQQPGAVEDLRRGALRAQFETNVFGPLELTTRVLPAMRRQGEGRIIQNSSVLGLVALPYRGAYNASKFALEGLSDTLRLELRDTNIHVSLIEPGPITSRLRQHAHQAFLRNIDSERSAHRAYYEGVKKRLAKKGPAQPFTLPPEAVLKKVIHALESPRPRRRYYVTLPTHLFGNLRRILPVSLLDRLLLAISHNENS